MQSAAPSTPRPSRWARLARESAFVREYLWTYRRLIAIGILALVVIDTLEVLPPIILKNAVDTLTDRGPTSTLRRLALAYLGVTAVQAVGRYAWRMYLIRTSVFAARDMRNRFSNHLFGLSSSFFDRHRIGDLMSLATSDVDAVRMMIGVGVLTFADALFYFLAIPIVMYRLSPALMWLALAPLPIVPWIVMRNERQIHVRFDKVQACLARLSAVAQENLSGIRVVKGFANEATQLRRFRELGEEYKRLNMSLARVQESFGPLLDFTMSLGLTLLLYVGGRALIANTGIGGGTVLTLGVFVAFQRYIQQMVWPMAALGFAMAFYRRSATSTARLQAVFSETSDVGDVPVPVLPVGFDRSREVDRAATPHVASPAPAPRTAGRIEFRALRFRFPGTEVDALQSITLDIAPGERVAFVGAVGAGKSALLSLLPRLYPVNRGMLLLDGVDINDWPLEELRRQVGFVSQDVFLFSESVVENVAFGIQGWAGPSGDVSAIHEATDLAGVHEDVLGLASSYDTRLGERGVNLSGGQKQRLTIARALARRPAVLVLDDALSSVDVHTEERILSSLRRRPQRNTEVIAAHRLSTIQDADRIAVLVDGRVAQLGTHEALITDIDGLYWRFYEQQRLREDLERYMQLDQEL